jgi:hypothetical protein
MLSQINPDDNSTYYVVDVNRLEGIKLNDYTETYIINEKTLTVYYPTGVLYKGVKYYKVTDELRGIVEESTNSDSISINISGNPVVWRASAILNVNVPGVDSIDITVENGWVLKWDYDKHPISYFATSGNTFTISNGIEINQNGLYTVYVENPEEKATVKYVVITKIDDINPKITWYETEQKYRLIDNETGIAQVRCKAGEYEDPGDYLIGGNGEPIEEFRERYLEAEADYNASYDLLVTRYNAAEITYDEYVILLNELESTHEYPTMKTQSYTVYVADYAENAEVIITDADDIFSKFFEF